MKTSVASGFGVILEFYDFLIYGFVSSVLAKLFFPSNTFLISLLLTFAVFAIGFAARPIGGIVFGHLGDRIGRRYTLIFTIGIMGIASLLTGLLPTYAQIGVLAPVLLTILRLVQGFSVGGEYGGAITLTAETAPPRHRGLYVSIAQMSNIGPLFALSMVLLMENLTGSAFSVYGWRILYFIGVLIAVVGLVIRLKIRESEIFKKIVENPSKGEKVPLLLTLRKYWKIVLLGLGFLISSTIAEYAGSVFIISYLSSIVKVPFTTIIYTLLGGLAAGALINIGAGAASDRVGRKPIMIAGAVLIAVFIYPYFVMVSTGNAILILIAQIIFYGCIALQTGPFVTMLSEMYPAKVRYTGMSLDYQLSTAIFGGTTPFIATFLIYSTHYNLAPTFLVLAGTIVTLIAFIISKETSRMSVNY
ncbi:MFS transporter [uncultured archaeon]|nr:MFS transporter [uncultured archaeon]